MRRAFAIAAALVGTALTSPAGATGLTDYGIDLRGEPESMVELDGYFRVRGMALHNLDLDRGPTPSGQLFYPVPAGDPSAQTLSFADARLRTDLSFYWPSGGAAVKVRIDSLDNVVLGSAPTGIPAASTSQDPASGLIVLKRAYAEVLTPFGVVAAGRMGNSWGLGMLANGGDCADCDSGDAADRIAFITPLFGHLWAAAYDYTAVGPTVTHQTQTRAIDVVPSAQVHTITAAAMHYTSDEALERRRAGGAFTFDYGAYVTHRWQNNDLPTTYLPTAQPVQVSQDQLMMRGYTATGADLWLRLYGPKVRVEIEAAYLNAKVEQPSLIPGVRLQDPATSDQFGVALQSNFGDRDDTFNGGLDGGFASGDPAPGFGAFPQAGANQSRAGDLDGPQAVPPTDNRVDNFRMHPDYRIDRILFREIVGAVTDAIYVRPHGKVTLFENAKGRAEFRLFGVASFAVEPASAPGGERPLAIEIDPTLAYESALGFGAYLEQATLIPLSGLDNRDLGLDAKPAQLWRARMQLFF